MERPAETHEQDVPGASGVPGTEDAAATTTTAAAVAADPSQATAFAHPGDAKIQAIDFTNPTTDPSQPAELEGPSRSSVNVTPEQLKDLANTLGATRLQGLRVANFAFEPVSLPASRIASHEDESHHTSRQQTPTPVSSPRLSARALEMHSPPLTPSGTPHLDSGRVSPRVSTDGAPSSPRGVITPQESTQDPSTSMSSPRGKKAIQLPEDDASRRPKSSSAVQDPVLLGNHRKAMFGFGPSTTSSSADGSGSGSGGKSLPASRDASPVRNDPASQFYTRPFTPAGDKHDPYAANKRQPQNKIEPRFVFSKLSRKKDNSRSASSVSINKIKDDDRRPSKHQHHHSRKENRESTSAVDLTSSHQSSMSDLRRFFKLGPAHHHKIKRAVSPAVSVRSLRSAVSGAASRSSTQIPFGDENSLTSKYGKLGKVLGSGAGGSVRLMKRSEDNTVFAVKEFRARHAYENEKDYIKKLTAEYCIGSSLHHGNIIETLDIIREKNKWYEVMEYAPYDLFAIVMTGKMSRAEIACCFLQILSGVTYLHSMGLAHRDLKLDNVVVSEHGIMKIIDFGSAHVFKYPFENGIVLASGIVGSDPYLAPEVYDEKKYDPTAVDIWSLAIIYCCMTLRRFPWKVPRLTDNSYKLFAADPSPGHDPNNLMLTLNKSPEQHRESRPSTDKKSEADDEHKKEAHETEEHKAGKPADVDETHVKAEEKPADAAKPHEAEPAAKDAKDKDAAEAAKDGKDDKDGKYDAAADGKAEKAADKPAGNKAAEKPAEKKEVIKGAWRILRLLPRESRNVIGGMLKIDPKERIRMEDLLKDPWVANTVICRQVEPGRVLRASTHTHILEQPTPAMK